jgi:hypothetical protein
MAPLFPFRRKCSRANVSYHIFSGDTLHAAHGVTLHDPAQSSARPVIGSNSRAARCT